MAMRAFLEQVWKWSQSAPLHHLFHPSSFSCFSSFRPQQLSLCLELVYLNRSCQHLRKLSCLESHQSLHHRRYSSQQSPPLQPTRPSFSPFLPSTSDLQRYVEAYIKYFHPHMPFLHIPTLNFASPVYAVNPESDNLQGIGGFSGGGGCLSLDTPPFWRLRCADGCSSVHHVAHRVGLLGFGLYRSAGCSHAIYCLVCFRDVA